MTFAAFDKISESLPGHRFTAHTYYLDHGFDCICTIVKPRYSLQISSPYAESSVLST